MTRRIVVTVSSLVAAGLISLALACSDTLTAAKSTQLSTTAIGTVSLAATPSSHRHRATDPLTQFVGKIHHDAMVDAIQNKAQWLATSGGTDKRSRVCNAAAMIAVKYGAQVDSAFHIHRSHADLVATAKQAVRSMRYCVVSSTMSVFGVAAIPMALTQEPDSVPTGDFLPYLDDISAAVEATDGSPYQVYSAMDGILASASTLSYADYQVVASAAELAESSADTWATQDWGSSGDSCEEGVGPCPILPFSVFAMPGWLKKTLATVIVDATSCVTAGVSTWYAAAAGPIGWTAIGAQCAIWGIGTSGGTALVFLATT